MERDVAYSTDRTIYLLRHGKSSFNKDGKRYIGQTDLELSGEGVRQARFWQAFFREISFSTVACSDLKRSEDTAKIIAEGRGFAVTKAPELREVNLGDWEGMRIEEVRERDAKAYRQRGIDLANYRPPHGESFGDLQGRVLSCFKAIVGDTTGNIVVVGHAGVNRILLCHLLAIPLENLFRIEQDYAALNIIAADQNGYRIRTINLSPALVARVTNYSV